MKKILEHNENSKCRDPFIMKHNGKYYHCFTEDSASVSLSCADSIEELKNANAKLVFAPSESTKFCSKEVWAPELHIIDGNCYIYFTGDDGENANHRMYVLTNNSSDPMANEYVMLGKITDQTDRWAIDGTILYHNGKTYYLWSGWEGDTNICQNIYIAQMSDPCTLSSQRVMISTPEYSWEKQGTTGEINCPHINEGPFAIYNGNETYVLYSASASWEENYCIAVLKLVGDNPLDPKAWEKFKEPIFSRNEYVKGAGHCSVFEDGGKQNIVFHAWDRQETKVSWEMVSIWQGELHFDGDEITIE